MNKFNLFDETNPYYPYRWLFCVIIVCGMLMSWFDYTGDGMFMQSAEERSSSNSSLRFHK